MPVLKPCIVGTMGSTTYYETTMTGRELAHTVRPAKETDGWASAGIEERMQREFNMNRIRTQLVPYLAKQADRFFGSVIVLVEPDSIVFEGLGELVTTLPAAYRDSAEHLGFITIKEGEHIALDGQHRLLAFREVITSGENLGEFASVVGEDEVCVLLLEFEDKRKTRRIFNNVNRHAKPTGRSDNIITSEDDGVAIVTRWLLDQDRNAPLARREIPGEGDIEIVNWTSNTLSKNSRHVTTISTIYEGVRVILGLKKFAWIDMGKNPIAPEQEELERAYGIVSGWWDKILTLDVFVNSLGDLTGMREARFEPTHHHTLLLRPVGQIALVEGLVLAIGNSHEQLTLTEALRRANQINWSCTPESAWRDTIVRADGRMVARKEARQLAARLIAYIIGAEFMTEADRQQLWKDWNFARGCDVEGDPEAGDPEGLPDPIEN